MNDRTPTGPALAARLAGSFDFDNATVRFEGRSYFVRCGATGKVQLVIDGERPPMNLGRMSEPLDVLATEFYGALIAADLPLPIRPSATCERCNHDTHSCPGCGAFLRHGVEVCSTCRGEVARGER